MGQCMGLGWREDQLELQIKSMIDCLIGELYNEYYSSAELQLGQQLIGAWYSVTKQPIYISEYKELSWGDIQVNEETGKVIIRSDAESDWVAYSIIKSNNEHKIGSTTTLLDVQSDDSTVRLVPSIPRDGSDSEHRYLIIHNGRSVPIDIRKKNLFHSSGCVATFGDTKLTIKYRYHSRDTSDYQGYLSVTERSEGRGNLPHTVYIRAPPGSDICDWPGYHSDQREAASEARTEWLRRFRDRIIAILVSVHGAKIRSIEPEILIRKVVQHCSRIGKLAEEVARAVTVDDIMIASEDVTNTTEPEIMELTKAWAKINTNGDHIVDNKEIAEMNLAMPTLKEGMTFKEFRDFWLVRGQIPEFEALYDKHFSNEAPTNEKITALRNIQSFHYANDPLLQHDAAALFSSKKSFCAFLKNPLNNGLAATSHDMTKPLSNYYISSSHNTYLKGNQLTGDSSSEMYSEVLNKSCRCVEIDAWEHEGNIVVYHGRTLTSKVPLTEVLQAIVSSAFVTNPYPVIISLENHISDKTAPKLCEMLTAGLKPFLLSHSDFDPINASPDSLRNRILIKGRPVESSRELTNLFALQKVSSFSENADIPSDMSPSKTLMRVYPGATRVASDNYDYLPFWKRGIHMISLNWQKPDRHLRSYTARFRELNHGCGYLLRTEPVAPWTIKTTIIRGWKFPIAFSAKGVVDPYVILELIDSSLTEQKLTTNPVIRNGFNPDWTGADTNNKAVFTASDPDSALLLIRVLDRDDIAPAPLDICMAEAYLPVKCLRSGIKSIVLRDPKTNEEMSKAGLICEFEVSGVGAVIEQDNPPQSIGSTRIREPSSPSPDAGSPVVGSFAKILPEPENDELIPRQPTQSKATQQKLPEFLDGRDPGHPVAYQYKKCFVVQRESLTSCTILLSEDSTVNVSTNKLNPIPLTLDTIELLSIPPVRKLWKVLVSIYGKIDPKKIPKSLEAAGKAVSGGSITVKGLKNKIINENPTAQQEVASELQLIDVISQEVVEELTPDMARITSSLVNDVIRKRKVEDAEMLMPSLVQERDSEISRLREQLTQQRYTFSNSNPATLLKNATWTSPTPPSPTTTKTIKTPSSVIASFQGPRLHSIPSTTRFPKAVEPPSMKDPYAAFNAANMGFGFHFTERNG